MSDSSSVLDFSSLQPSDYGASDVGLQDYSSFDSLGLAAPALDAPLGTDPLSGVDLPLPGGATDPFAPSLTVLPPDASNGVNAYNDQLLPLSPASTVDTSVYGSSAQALGAAGTTSSGSTLDPTGNLPLAPIASVGASLTALGSKVITSTNPNPAPMGASLWSSLFSTVGSALGVSKAGTAGKPVAGTATVPGTVKTAPPAVGTNPISNTSTIGIFVIVFALLGVVLWSFSGE